MQVNNLPNLSVASPKSTNKITAQSLSGGRSLGSGVVESAANNIANFNRPGAGAVAPKVPNIAALLQSISSNIISNVENITGGVKNVIQGGITNVKNIFGRKEAEEDPNKILSEFLGLYKKALDYIKFFADPKQIKGFDKAIGVYQDSLKETGDIIVGIRKFVKKMIKDFQKLKNELSNLGGGGGFQLPSLPLPGLPGRNPRPRPRPRMPRARGGKLGLGLLGLGLLGGGAMAASKFIGDDNVQGQQTETGSISAEITDKFNSVLDKFESILDNFDTSGPDPADPKLPKVATDAKVDGNNPRGLYSEGNSLEEFDPNKKYKTGDTVLKDGVPKTFDGMGWAADDRSKLERDIVDFRQMRYDQFGVSKDRVDVAPGENFNMAIRELRGAEGGTSINPLADDDSYQDIHVSHSHKHGYGFDVPIANPEQANAVIKFFQDRGYSTYHGAQDPTGAHDHHVHVEAPNADVLKRPSEMVKPPRPAPAEPPVKPNVPEQQASLSTSPQSVSQVAQLPGSSSVQVLPTAQTGQGSKRQTISPPPSQAAKIENNIPTNLSPEDGDNPLILGTISQLNILAS
jgi:hypothetical protein